MDTTRPLHDVFADLAGTGGGADAAEVLRASGHEALPDALVAEAVVTYADTAPIEVTEHLSGFVQAHSAVPRVDDGTEPPGWLDALSTAPTVVGTGQIDAADIDPGDSLDATPEHPAAATWPPTDVTDGGGLDDAGFGAGGGPAAHVDDRSEPMVEDVDPAVPVEHLGPDLADRDGAAADLGRVDLDSDADDLAADPADLDDL